METHSRHEKFHGQRSLVGYSLWCLKELDITERMCASTHTYFFFNTYCYCTLNRPQYKVNITFMCTGKPKNPCFVYVFISIFTLLWWSETEPAVSLKYACINPKGNDRRIKMVHCKIQTNTK